MFVASVLVRKFLDASKLLEVNAYIQSGVKNNSLNKTCITVKFFLLSFFFTEICLPDKCKRAKLKPVNTICCKRFSSVKFASI